MNNTNQTDNSSNPLNCLNTTTVNTDECKIVDDSVLRQFKIIMIFVLIILLIFLGFFIYNLIKCYLPKWRKNKDRPVEISDNYAN